MHGITSKFSADGVIAGPLITFGTPYRGSVKALGYLAHGRAGPRSLLIPTARTMPSIYQLLPVYPVLYADGGAHRVAEGPENGRD